MKEMKFYSYIQSDRSDVSRKMFTSGPTLPDYKIEHSNIDHEVRINDNPPIHFTKSEYQLLMLILERIQEEYVSYTEIAQCIYECKVDEKLLQTIRRRMSDIRRKVTNYGIDIINIPHRGYKVCQFNNLVVPYRR